MSLALAATLSALPSCKKYTQEQLDSAVTQAANENYDLGYQDGKTDGYALGLQDGYKKAVDDFANGNLSAVYNQGFNAGYSTGYAEGDAVGYSDGYNKGKSDGYAIGYNAGYDKGASDGYKSGFSAGTIVGYNDGYDDGYFDGDADGYADGYADGEFDGYQLGYDDGYEDGWVDCKFVDCLTSGGGGFSAGQGKISVAAKMAGDVIQSMFNFKELKSPKEVIAEATSKNSELSRFLNTAGTSIISKNIIQEKYLVSSLQNQLVDNYGLKEERALQVAILANKFIRTSGERSFSATEASLLSKEVLGSDVATISSAVEASATGNSDALNAVVKNAAAVNQISEAQAQKILFKLFI
ncbi:MAG: hypothetical protein QE271_11060 [Bacteriovoracaceae bacterium]|nr:hypothetical protein [Bacteriovoracaceae bacterium]